MADVAELAARIAKLPPERIAEVSDFVEFLGAKGRAEAWDRLLSVAPALDAAGLGARGEAEIDQEITAARAERRGVADRS